jgi:molybdate transport system substrate-binding protein
MKINHRLSRWTKALAVVAAAGLAFTACASGGTSGDTSSADTTVLTVFAAASLTESFDQIATDFEAANPGVDVQVNYAGSQTLVDQIDNGASADVLATANDSTMKKATDADLVGEPSSFATNVLTLITPTGNPAGITGLDQSLVGAKLVICAPAVPCGAATVELTDLLGVTLAPVSEEQQVTDVRTKVSSGEADAGIVYRTDAMAEGDDVDTVDIERADEVVNNYPIATVNSSQHKELAQDFASFVLADGGRDVLIAHGFTVPAP